MTGIRQAGGRVTGVDTAAGAIRAEFVVNCAGLWAREVGRMAGVNVPLLAAEHFYVVTDASPDIPRNLPVLRVPDECAYVKEEAGKLLVGFFEPKGKPLPDRMIPEDSEFLNLPDDWDHLARELELASERLPILKRIGLHTFFNGPESFTPDGRWILGEAPSLRNFFVAAGFNSIGIQTAGGVGMAIAEWMEAGEPTFDLTGYDIRRCQPFQGNTHLPRRPHRRGARPALCRPVPLSQSRERARRAHHAAARAARRARRLLRRGGRLGARRLVPARGRARPRREGGVALRLGAAALVRAMSPRSTRPCARASACSTSRPSARSASRAATPRPCCSCICANDVAVAPGRIVYTPWLNRNGGMEADVTVSRLSDDAFLVVTSSASVLRDLAWLKRHIPDGAHCVATDVTVGEACLGVMGPRSRELLASLIDVPLGNDAFPFGTWREVEIGYAVARAHRISFVGELGWELYVPVDMARHVFDTLMARGADVGLRLCGTHALNSCRLEKAYRDYGHDIASTDHVLEAGLGFAVKLDKAKGRFGDFIGREAVLRRKQAGLSRRLVQFLLADPRPLLYGNEAILRDGRVVGYLTSGAYGHHLGAAVGLGYVACRPGESADELLASSYAIEVAGEQVAARASLEPLYDPKAARLRM